MHSSAKLSAVASEANTRTVRSRTTLNRGPIWASWRHKSETTADRSLCNCRSKAHQIKFGMCVSFASSSRRASGRKDRHSVAGAQPLAARRELAAHLRIGLGRGQSDELGLDRRVHPVVVAQQADRPAPDRGERMPEQLEGHAVVEAAADVKSPEVAQGRSLVSVVSQERFQSTGRPRIAALGEDPPRLAANQSLVLSLKSTSSALDRFARSNWGTLRRSP